MFLEHLPPYVYLAWKIYNQFFMIVNPEDDNKKQRVVMIYIIMILIVSPLYIHRIYLVACESREAIESRRKIIACRNHARMRH